jgi:hypothetical protein
MCHFLASFRSSPKGNLILSSFSSLT